MLGRTAVPCAGGAIIAAMKTPALVLASASPRRQRLMPWLCADFEVAATSTDEDLTSPLRAVPPVLARSLACEKALAAREMRPDAETIVAFDTIVVLDGRVLGKPADRADARRMLEALSGRTHQVVTGVAMLRHGTADPVTFAVTALVTMRELDAGTIDAWLAGDEALGCAGAYNIERHMATVDDGECYQNVAGLPLCHVYERLRRLGVEGLQIPAPACAEARGACCALGESVCARAR